MLNLKFFSAPLLLVENQPLAKLMGSPTLVSLLAYLVMQRERPLARAFVAAVFWPESSEMQARRNLNSHLYRLKTLLGSANYFCSERETIQFNPRASFWLDVLEFETRTAQLVRASDSTETQPLESAAALYRGEFLEGVYDDWTLPYREHLRERYLLVLQRLAEAHHAQANFDAAIRAAARWVQTDSFSETAHYQLIQLYALNHRLNDAQIQFQKYQTIWRAELGLEPSARMCALADQFQLTPPSVTIQMAAARLAQLEETRETPAHTHTRAPREQRESDALNLQIAAQARELGLAFQERGNPGQAARYLTRALDALAALPQSLFAREQEWSIRVACDELYDWDANWNAALENLAALQRLAKEFDTPSHQAEVCARLAWVKICQSHHAKGIALAEETLRLAMKHQDWKHAAWARRLLGVAHDHLGNYRDALVHYRAALHLDETCGSPEHLPTDLNNIACVLETMGDFESAEKEFERARALLSPQTPLRIKITLQANLGNLWTKLERYDEAARELNQALDWIKRLGERERECWVGACLARLYQRRGEIERALLLAHHYSHVAQKLDAAQRQAELAAVLASLYIAQHDAAHAREWAAKLNTIAEQQNFWRYRVRAAMRMAQVHRLLHQPNEAMQWANRAVAWVQQRDQILEETAELYAIAAQCGVAQI